jgi:hypothetical protein
MDSLHNNSYATYACADLLRPESRTKRPPDASSRRRCPADALQRLAAGRSGSGLGAASFGCLSALERVREPRLSDIASRRRPFPQPIPRFGVSGRRRSSCRTWCTAVCSRRTSCTTAGGSSRCRKREGARCRCRSPLLPTHIRSYTCTRSTTRLSSRTPSLQSRSPSRGSTRSADRIRRRYTRHCSRRRCTGLRPRAPGRPSSQGRRPLRNHRTACRADLAGSARWGGRKRLPCKACRSDSRTHRSRSTPPQASPVHTASVRG